MVALISRAELDAELRAGTVAVVDALPASYYESRHLPGALNLVAADVAAQASKLLPDRDAAIVTYCSNAACPNSDQVARQLVAHGYTNVRRYEPGIEDWVEAGLPTEP